MRQKKWEEEQGRYFESLKMREKKGVGRMRFEKEMERGGEIKRGEEAYGINTDTK